MKYPSLSFKNQELLRHIRCYKDARLELKRCDFPNYQEADIYELIECGYFRCETSQGHIRTQDNNWSFVGFVTYKGHTYYRGRFNEYIKNVGYLGGWIALIEFILKIINYT